MKTHPVAPRVADSLAAANADAQRFFGDGPVREWHPPASRRWWPTGGLLAAAAALAAWGAGWLDGPAGADPAIVVAAAPPLPGPTEPGVAAPAPAAVRAAAAPAQPCAAMPCTGAAAPIAPAPGRLAGAGAAPPSAWPADPDDWALDPQTIGTPAAAPSRTRRALHNVPDIPDDADPTPAEESSADGESGGGPAD